MCIYDMLEMLKVGSQGVSVRLSEPKKEKERERERCVCVCTICIDVKLLYSRGATAHLPMLPNEATEDAVEGFMDA